MTALYRIDNMVFAYRQAPVLNIQSLEIESEKVTALIGPNGSGKSTLFKLLAFLAFPNHGQILFMGERPVKPKLLEIRRRIGLVPQNPYFVQGSVRQNIELGLLLRGVKQKPRRDRAILALERVGMESFQSCNVRELSGGEAQKVALARTLAYEPEVILFDEPFTYLDHANLSIIERLISDYRAEPNKSVVFTTHDKLHGLALADRNISLLSGNPVPGHLVNLFHGKVDNGNFLTGKLSILLPRNLIEGSYLAVDPAEIVLSLDPLDSSIRNSFKGVVVAISDDQGRIRITVRAGEIFHVLITLESLNKLALTITQPVWLGFKSTAVKVF